uniref:Uncharacterized protein n=1 Tax=Parascaris univalens TaxID=6257 RepID=A0A915BI29_PARUN
MQNILSSIRGAISHDALKISQPEALTNKEKKTLIQQWTTLKKTKSETQDFKHFTLNVWHSKLEKSRTLEKSAEAHTKAFGMEENEDPEKNEMFMRLPSTIEAFFKDLLIDCECDEKKVCMIEGIKECSMDLNEEQQKNFVLAWQHLLDIVVRDMRNGYDERRRKEAKA